MTRMMRLLNKVLGREKHYNSINLLEMEKLSEAVKFNREKPILPSLLKPNMTIIVQKNVMGLIKYKNIDFFGEDKTK